MPKLQHCLRVQFL